MGYKDPEKRRAYDRELKRRKRAEEKLGKLTATPTRQVAEATRTRTVKTTRVETALDDLRLENLDVEIYQFGVEALDKAREGLAGIEPSELSVLDIKRLAELGIKMRNLAAANIEKREVTEEQRVVLTERILADPEALEHAEELLRLSAAEDLAEGLPDEPEGDDSG